MVVGAVLLLSYSRFDLFKLINGHYTPLMNEVMFYATWMGEATVIIPALVAVMLVPKYRNAWFVTLATACNVVPMVVQQSVKSLLNWPRPMHFFEHNGMAHMMDNWDRIFERSFPSGHSEGAFSFLCFLSILLMPKYKALGLVFFVLAVSASYSRVYLGAHFFEDVYAGSIIGVVVCTAVYVVMHRYFKKYFETTA